MRLNELLRHCSAQFFRNDAVVTAHDIKKQQYDDKSNINITQATVISHRSDRNPQLQK